MQNRSPITVILLTFITFGIYGLIWEIQTASEMRKLGAEIPTSWLIIVPIANIYWLYKYCEGVEKISSGKYSAVLMFLLFWLTGVIGMFLAQTAFNEAAAGPVPAAAPMQAAPVAQAAPEAPSVAPTDTTPQPPAQV